MIAKWRLAGALFVLGCAPAAWSWELEVGKVVLAETSSSNEAFQNITFASDFNKDAVVPLVFVLGQSDASPYAVRIKEVTSTGFKAIAAVPQTASDGYHAATNISYLAITPGTHVLPDGTQINAQSVVLTENEQVGSVAANNKGYTTENLNLEAVLSSAPVILAQIQDMSAERNTLPGAVSDPWMTVAVTDTTTTTAKVALERSEATTLMPSNSSITVGLLTTDAATSGTFEVDENTTISYQFLRTTTEATESPGTCTSVVVDAVMTEANAVVLGHTVTRSSTDGGWLARCASSVFDVTIEEDTLDAERANEGETVALMVFSNSFHHDFASGGAGSKRFTLAHPERLIYCEKQGLVLSAVSNSNRPLLSYARTVQLESSDEVMWYLPGRDPVQSRLVEHTFLDENRGQIAFEIMYSGNQSQVTLKATEVSGALTPTIGDHEVTLPFNPQALQFTLLHPDQILKAGEPFAVRVRGVSGPGGMCRHDALNGSMGNLQVWSSLQDTTLSKATYKTLHWLPDPNRPQEGVKVLGKDPNNATSIPFKDDPSGDNLLYFSYPDVGAVVLGAQYTVNDTLFSGESDPWVVQPYALQIMQIKRSDGQELNQNDLNAITQTQAYDSYRGILVAGEPFHFRVEGHNKQGGPLMQLGKEQPAQEVILKGATLSPAQGHGGDLVVNGPVVWKEGGVSPRRLEMEKVSYHEVGFAAVTPTIKNYLGSGEVRGDTQVLGRFVPEKFLVDVTQQPKLKPGCTGFTYFRQPFYYDREAIFTLQPVSRSGAILKNYRNFGGKENYFKLSDLSIKHEEQIASAVYDVKAQGDHVTPQFEDRVTEEAHWRQPLRYQAKADSLMYDFKDQLREDIKPFYADLTMTVLSEGQQTLIRDKDAVKVWPPQSSGFSPLELPLLFSADPKNKEEDSEIRHGRLYLGHTFWPLSDNIQVPITLQYFNGFSFVTNQDDACTTTEEALDTQKIMHSDFKVNHSKHHDLLKNAGFKLGTGVFQKGQQLLEIIFSKNQPITDARGEFRIWMPIKDQSSWLKYDWPSDGDYSGDYDDSPDGMVYFGAPAASDYSLLEYR